MNGWSEAESIDFRGPLDVTSAATVLLDSENVVIGWSEAAEDLFGYAPREILGRSLKTLLVGRSTQEHALIELLDRSVGPTCRNEARIARHRDGHAVEVATTICSLAGDDGAPQIMVAAALEPLRAWESHQAMLRGLATQSPIGLGIYDTDLRLTWANAKYQSEIDRKFSEYAGKRVYELYADGEVLSEGYPQPARRRHTGRDRHRQARLRSALPGPSARRSRPRPRVVLCVLPTQGRRRPRTGRMRGRTRHHRALPGRAAARADRPRGSPHRHDARHGHHRQGDRRGRHPGLRRRCHRRSGRGRAGGRGTAPARGDAVARTCRGALRQSVRGCRGRGRPLRPAVSGDLRPQFAAARLARLP